MARNGLLARHTRLMIIGFCVEAVKMQ